MKKIILIGLLVLPLVVFGQDKTQEQSDKPPAAEALSEEEQEAASILPGEFIYNPEGRRDPFWNLLQGKSVKENREFIEGIAGLIIDELELEGIVITKGTYIAQLKGPDSIPYFVKVGDKVYDGEVIAIDRNSISFRKSLTIAMVGQKERVIVKTLNPEEEGASKDEKNME